MMTSSNGNFFRVTGLLCGEFTGHRNMELNGLTTHPWYNCNGGIKCSWSYDIDEELHFTKNIDVITYSCSALSLYLIMNRLI